MDDVRQTAPAPLTASTATLLALAWPIVLTRATQSVVGFADALMVAPLGAETLAAVTTGALDTYAFAMLPMGTVFIVQSFAAQLHGRGDLHAARRYAYYGLMIAAVAGLLAAFAIPFVPALLAPLGYAPRVHAEMSSYMAIRMWSVAAFVGSEALGNWYGGLGNTRLAMIGGVVTMVTNVIGNYLLIEPHFGLPGYGAAGAAAASAISSWLGFLVIAGAFALRRGYPGGMPSGRVPLQLRASELLRVLRFGLPNGVNWFLEFASFMVFINVVVGGLGTSVLAAMNVVIQINSISFMPAFGLASAGAILVGNAIGARERDRVSGIVKRTLWVTCAWQGSVGLLYWLLPGPLIELFRPPGAGAAELLAAGAIMLALSAFWQVFDAGAMTLSEALRSAGDTTFCMNARIVLAWFVFIPVAWYSVRVRDGGVQAVILSLTGYLALLALAFGLRFLSGRWRKIDLLGSEGPHV
jgi:multidrug resistance protein, MATE family